MDGLPAAGPAISGITRRTRRCNTDRCQTITTNDLGWCDTCLQVLRARADTGATPRGQW